MAISGFELSTTRLLLRPLETGDADALASVYDDPDVGRFIGALDVDGTRAQIGRFAEQWRSRGYGPLGIVERSSGEVVGRCGLRYWPEFDEVEAGWVLRRDRWGLGYATEAGAASVEWGLEALGLPLVTAIIAKDNAASIAVAKRLGMTPLREDHIFGWDVTVYHRTS